MSSVSSQEDYHYLSNFVDVHFYLPEKIPHYLNQILKDFHDPEI